MQKQLLLFHNAVSAYFAGNQAALESTMKQFAIKVPGGQKLASLIVKIPVGMICSII